MTIAHASVQDSADLVSDRDVVDTLAASIDVYSPRSILEFGSAVAEATSRYTDDILSKARASDLDETGKTLTDIVMTAQDFDMSSLDNPMGRLPLIGGALKFLSRGKERAVARFDSVKTQIDKLVASVDATAARMERQDRDYSAIYKGIREEHAQLGLHVQAIDHRLIEVERGRDNLKTSNDMADIEQAAVLEAACQFLAKRKDDLLVLQHAAMQSLPMVRILQSNNLALIDKFTTIRTLTLPAWKRTFLLALSLDEQKQAAGLATAIDEATNVMMKRNAELLKQNSVAVAKANQRLVIDVETLKSVHDNVIQTLDEVRAIHLDGKASRSKALSELGRLRSEMSATVRSLSSQTVVIDG
ncbi:toxic anion resistance protein [Rhizobium sp. G21]|uniref:toxic anion resistance protein n=1 Tax=Rhizobium sp. G21 TaxID=2758439 RepID=UPI0016041E59|nr:toxic anion resistance protein [Rhizobium sp. G21]